MKKLILLFLLPVHIMAQNHEAQKLMSSGGRCYTESKYDSAIHYYTTYLNQFGNENISESCTVLNNMADIYNTIGDGKKSRIFAERVIQTCDSSEDIEKVASAYINISNTVAIYDSDFDSALFWVNKGIELLHANDIVSKVLAQAYRSQGVTFYDLVQYQNAIDSYNKSLEIFASIGENEKQSAITLNNLANAYDGLGQYYKGLKTHFLSLKSKRTIYPEIHPEIAMSLNNIGNSYHYLEQHEKAIEYFMLALEQRIELFGYNHRRIASVFNNLGNVYFDQKEFEKSKKAHLRALNIRKNIFNSDHSILIYSYTNLARTYDALNNSDSALFYSKLAISIHEKNYEGTTDLLAAIYQNLGVFYQNNKIYDKANYYLNKSLAHYTNNYGIKHPRVGSIMNALGELKADQSDYQLAVAYYQKGLIAIVEDFESTDPLDNPTSAFVLDPGELIKIFNGKATALYSIYKQNRELDKELLSRQLFATLKAADQYIQHFRKDMSRRSDIQNLGEQSIFIYKILVDLNNKQFVLTADESYVDSAFVAMEKSKSNLLLRQLTDYRAKIDASIPDSLLSKQIELQILINEYKSKGELTSLHKMQKEYEKLISSFEKGFPEYYDLKYRYQFGSTDEVKGNLKSNEALIEYQIVDSLLFTLYIDKENRKIIKKPLPSDFSKLVVDYMTYLSDPTIPRDEEIENLTDKLSETLFGSVLNESRELDHLIIIPDGIIGVIPLETLNDLYQDGYLFSQYNIQYAYSAKTLFYDRRDTNASGQIIYGGFAPFYDDALKRESFSTLRSSITPLYWNKVEVESISESLGGEKFIGTNATESNFITHANKYEIVHLATHASLDQDDPMNSRLFFDLLNDSLQDGMLHAFEIYNLNLNADLVVLSACNTGTGEFSDGEGVMSIAHAFRYSGASGVVMSHWPVDDNSTYKIMSSFFENLSNGDGKSMALRKAKLDFISEAEPERKHPFYWASFTLIGDDESIRSLETKWRYVNIYLILAGILFFSLWIWKRYSW
jgi:tetratricopeptide (TPR) repeat protein